MNSSLKKEVLDLIINKKIIKIGFSRGLGIIPSKFIIYLDGNHKYNIEVESNFRIIDNKKLICCFEDLYMTMDKKIISKKMFNKQNDIEFTYLSTSLMLANSFCYNKQITKCKISSYGDISICLDNKIVLQALNDNQYDESIIFRIIDVENKKISKFCNGKEYEIYKNLYELVLKNGKAEIMKDK